MNVATQVEAERIVSVGSVRPTAIPLAASAAPLATETMLRRLATSMYVELRTIECQFCRGVLTLTGLVPTFYLKAVITSLAENIEGVSQINNQVEVIDFRARSRSLSA
jgi:osmotically-inducible protein OsmY